jgi:hypothetical protein
VTDRRAERTVGDAGDDIFIDGVIALDVNPGALFAISAARISARKYATSVAKFAVAGSILQTIGNCSLSVDGQTCTAIDDRAEDFLPAVSPT